MNSRVLPDAPDEPRLDRLPWLESADFDVAQGPSPIKVIVLILLGLGLIAAAVFAYDRLQSRGGPTGSGELITAQQGDYKVKPDQPGGMKVDGEGDTVFATSEGGASNSAVDPSKVPEVPVAGKAAASAKATGPGTRTVVTAIPAPGGARLAAATPATAAPKAAAETGGGSVVQLGSFPSEASANGAWVNASKRFAYLAALGKSVEKAEVGGNTVYRLRVNTGSAGNAASICGRLKVAGEPCYIPR